MTIVGLYGNGNSGKSTILKTLALNLIEDNNSSLVDIEKVKWSNDFRFAFTYEQFKICITTSGDDEYANDCNYEFVSKHNPNLWILASHSKGGSVNSILKIASSDEIKWIKKNQLTQEPIEENKHLHKPIEEANILDLKRLVLHIKKCTGIQLPFKYYVSNIKEEE